MTDPIAARLAQIAADLLDYDVEPEDNFFDVGGYSLLVVKLVSEARKAGIDLAASIVFEHQTFTGIAAALAGTATAAATADETFDDLWKNTVSPWQQPPAQTVLPLTEGEGAPFFCVHWGSGNIEFLGRFAEQFGYRRPLYGIRSGMLARRERPLLTIGDRAERHLAEIRAIQPHGPYHLGGLCSGGLVAYEIAQRLTAQGETVADLALINCAPATAPHGFDFGWGLADFYRFRLAWLSKRYGVEDLSAAAPTIMPELTSWDWYDQDAKVEDWNWLHLVWASLAFAQIHYEARPYTGPTRVFQQAEYAADPRLSWAPLAADLVEHVYPHADTWDIVKDAGFWEALGKTSDGAR
ncbi:hypothetical protein Cs7R123_02260 [Catellatospora sp. TT07R-123]|uniref:thioesterase domain-containing protein n=1 Tax=Catellatospora sp. TT07R-123 TaxID=2733863 RepID=UPI001B230FBF|nr:thioesterase domain-containing protein [Catellatospora sp. TT07R-123]GHJ42884.1 hypothetical protein Cs7R123_02260 [Catellatospora sp. TT07R-123]